jgi:hypothetical protein
MRCLVFDTGALIALDRNDRETWALLRVASDEGHHIEVPAGAIAQAWRSGQRQALLVRALRHCDEVPLDGALARAAGILCGQSQTSDIVDASVAIVAAGRSRHASVSIVTSDRPDLQHLIEVLDIRAQIVEC